MFIRNDFNECVDKSPETWGVRVTPSEWLDIYLSVLKVHTNRKYLL